VFARPLERRVMWQITTEKEMRVYDEEDAAKLNAERWQLDLLNLNPSYVHWGPHEDYMWKEKEGWDGRVINDTWADFGPWTLDEYNECVNFYFSVIRDSKDCPTCGGNGYHPDAQGVVNTFYAHMNERGEHWNDKITQDELEALIEGGRVKAGTTVEEVNAQNRPGTRAMGHDAINSLILTSARLKRLGVTEKCPECGGDGSVFTTPAAHVTLTLWMLHPRKGCSRGVEVSRVEEADLPAIFAWLNEAATRNAQRFSKLPALTHNV